MTHYVLRGIVLTFCLALVAPAQEQKVKAADVPPAVTAAAVKAYPRAKISGWSKETEDGKLTYEASMTEGAVKRDVQFAEDGALLATEEVISMAEVPTAVQEALKANYPKAAVVKVEKIMHGSEVQYEFALKKAAHKEVVFSPDGKIVKTE